MVRSVHMTIQMTIYKQTKRLINKMCFIWRKQDKFNLFNVTGFRARLNSKTPLALLGKL